MNETPIAMATGTERLEDDLLAARSHSVVAALSHLAVLRFSGEDAQVFLQGQLTCDVAALPPDGAVHGGYCSPKGRLLASFLLWHGENDYRMALPMDIAPAAHKRLAMFVLRAKVRIKRTELALIGCAGPAVPEALRSVFGTLPANRLRFQRGPGEQTVIRLDDARFLAAMPAADAGAAIERLSAALRPVDPRAWQWLDIRAGIPWIVPATQDQFVPQMVNLECIGGVSFTKGCYTGQEVVARAQHLGRVKRRMFLANLGAAAAPGDELFAEDLGDQASGRIVNASPSPEGGHDMLAVVPTGSHDASRVHLKSLDGPVLKFLSLPYPVQ